MERPAVHASLAWPSAESRARAPNVSPSTVETGEGLRTEPAVAKNGTAGARGERVLARGAVGQPGCRQRAPQPRRRLRRPHRLDLDQLVFERHRRPGRLRNLRGRSGGRLGIPHPYLGRRRVHGERCERHNQHQTGATGHIPAPEARRVPRGRPDTDVLSGHGRGSCHVLFAGLYMNVAPPPGPAAVDCSGSGSPFPADHRLPAALGRPAERGDVRHLPLVGQHVRERRTARSGSERHRYRPAYGAHHLRRRAPHGPDARRGARFLGHRARIRRDAPARRTDARRRGGARRAGRVPADAAAPGGTAPASRRTRTSRWSASSSMDRPRRTAAIPAAAWRALRPGPRRSPVGAAQRRAADSARGHRGGCGAGHRRCAPRGD